MIKSIYQDYFQKSFTFLYPLLNIKKKLPRPVKTFLFHPDYNQEDNEKRLFCLYKKENTESWKKFEKDFLITHKMLEDCYEIDKEHILYVFNMNEFKEDIDFLLEGKYSKFSQKTKKLITDYYGIHTPEWVYIESFLFPSKYFSIYSELLNVEISILEDIGELCSLYDKEKEIFILENIIQQN